MKHLDQVVDYLLLSGARKATKYVSPAETIKATRHGKPSRRERSITIVVTVGRPNFAERKFIRDCKKAGVTFPVAKVQLKHWPKPKKGGRAG